MKVILQEYGLALIAIVGALAILFLLREPLFSGSGQLAKSVGKTLEPGFLVEQQMDSAAFLTYESGQ